MRTVAIKPNVRKRRPAPIPKLKMIQYPRTVADKAVIIARMKYQLNASLNRKSKVKLGLPTFLIA